MNHILNEAEFSFIKNGNVFIIEKDRYNTLYPFVALGEFEVDMFLRSPYKTIVRDTEGEIIMANFGDIGKKDYDLTGVHALLSEVEEDYNAKEKLLVDIDKALAEGNKELFLELTNQLKEVS